MPRNTRRLPVLMLITLPWILPVCTASVLAQTEIQKLLAGGVAAVDSFGLPVAPNVGKQRSPRRAAS